MGNTRIVIKLKLGQTEILTKQIETKPKLRLNFIYYKTQFKPNQNCYQIQSVTKL